jgi:hypothetical protein
MNPENPFMQFDAQQCSHVNDPVVPIKNPRPDDPAAPTIL